MPSSHFRKTKKNRKGYFEKNEKGMPRRGYARLCKNEGRGYVGAKHEAHHILPQDAFQQSLADVQENDARMNTDKKGYIEDCKHISPYNINNKNNLMGLPHLIAYIIYFKDEGIGSHSGTIVKALKSFAKDKRFTATTRKRYKAEMLRNSPEKHPIHQPVNWGHKEYTEEVAKEIKKYVWDKLNEKQKEHDVDAGKIAENLEGVENDNFDFLIERGRGATKNNWAKRHQPNNNTWYIPFTMYDAPNPLR